MQRNDSNSKIDLIEEVPVANTDSVGGSKAGIKGEPPVNTLGYKKDNERLQKTTMKQLKQILNTHHI